ncbi:MAG: hypothetical protein ACE5PV_17755 [Candidatus Poribacteria bacterium]
MYRNLVSHIALQGLPVMLLVMAFLPFHQAVAQEPLEGVFIPRPGEFVSAEYPRVFDVVRKGGLTIEVWFLIKAVPGASGRWVLFGKSGNYWAEIEGNAEGWKVWVNVYCQSPNGNRGMSRGYFDSKKLNQWIHVALQFIDEAKVQKSFSAVFLQGRPKFGAGHKDSQCKLIRSESPLLIGWRRSRDNSPQELWIDQVRISRTLRYPSKLLPRPLPVDKDTLALWNFDEGPWANRYRDASGNRYTLFRNGIRAINGKEKLTTTWGKIKTGK